MRPSTRSLRAGPALAVAVVVATGCGAAPDADVAATGPDVAGSSVTAPPTGAPTTEDDSAVGPTDQADATVPPEQVDAAAPTEEEVSTTGADPTEAPADDDDVQAAEEGDRVQPDVIAEFESEGRVHVFVSLDASDDPDEIAAAADRLLADLDGTAFALRTRYESVPAIAGTVTGESALDVLRDHPDVVTVSLDPDGSGDGGGGGGGG